MGMPLRTSPLTTAVLAALDARWPDGASYRVRSDNAGTAPTSLGETRYWVRDRSGELSEVSPESLSPGVVDRVQRRMLRTCREHEQTVRNMSGAPSRPDTWLVPPSALRAIHHEHTDHITGNLDS